MFDTLLRSWPDYVFVKDRQSRFIKVNLAMARLLGLAATEDVLGKGDVDFWPPDDARRFYDREQAMMAGESPRISDEEDSYGKVHLTTKMPFHDAQGEVAGLIGISRDITDQKQAEAQIGFQASLLDAVEQAVIATDMDGRITFWNRFAGTLYGWQADEVLGRSILEMFPSQDGQYGVEILRQLQRGESLVVEHLKPRKDGSSIAVGVTISPVHDSSGRYLGTVSVGGDITERRRAEQQLQQAKQRSETILESIADGFCAIDHEWRFTYLNAAAERMLGRRQDELIGRFVLDEFPEAQAAGIYDKLLAASKSNQPAEFELFYPPLGIWLAQRAYPHADGLSVYFRDVTEQHKINEALQQSRGELEAALEANQAIIENSFDVICAIDEDGVIARVSPRCRDAWGYAPEEMVGRLFVEFLHLEDRQKIAAAWAAARAGKPTGDLEVRLIRKGGSVLQLLLSAAWSAQHKTIFIVARDLTQRLETEARLRQAQALEAVGQLTGGVAHDFNNLLMIVTGNAELLVDLVGDDPDAAPPASRIVEAAKRGAELTQRLVAFSRRQTLNPVALDLDKVVDGILKLLGRTLGKQIEIGMDLGADLPKATADLPQLEAALLNLAVNARDAMPEGGRLMVTTSAVEIVPAAMPDWPDAAPGRYLQIAVSDTGTGMNEAVAARVFEPFFTTKEFGKGSGLGLSMVYGFAKQSGGHVAIDSKLGRGTTVRLYLPALAAAGGLVASAKPDQGPASAHGPAQGNETILVVEDEPDVRCLVVRLLKRLGYRVVEAEDGQAALAILRQDDAIDLLFTDVILPGGQNGPSLAAAALQLRKHLKILFTTGYAETAFPRAGGTGQDVAILQKPYHRADLAQAVRAALGDGAGHVITLPPARARLPAGQAGQRLGGPGTAASG